MTDRIKKLKQAQLQASDHSDDNQDSQTTRHSLEMQSDFN